jgi:hypothetical protein
MILEKKTETLVLEDGEVQESTTMEIDADSHIFLMRMLSKFYSDGIGSLIRETASNALDSHRQCDVNDPIIVSFKKDKNNNYEFSVQDFGCGLDANDVENIIKKYGKSTKRNSDKQLGAFGLGFKSPLAYTTAFYFIGRKDGIERKWMLYESDDESNKIDLLYESPTTEKNGVKIIVPVKYGDHYDFIKKIKEQLAYFENVYFDGISEINNDDIKIVRGEHFQWSSLSKDAHMHICLDNVYYPIDFTKLGISDIVFPVGLRFSLKDGIFPVPNREQLKYTKEAKDIILKKIKLVADYFISKYNESVRNTDNIFDIFNYYGDHGRNIPHIGGDKYMSMDVRSLQHHSSFKFIIPKLKNVTLTDLKKVYERKEFLIREHELEYTFRSGKFSSAETKWNKNISWHSVTNGEIYAFTELNGLKKIYLREQLKGYKYFVKKRKPFLLGDVKKKNTHGLTNYIGLFDLDKYPRKEWRDRIKEGQYIISLITSKFTDLDKMEIPKDWLDNREAKRKAALLANKVAKRKKILGEISAKVAKPLERYVSGKNCKFVPELFQMKDAHKSKTFRIYGGIDDEPLLQDLYKILVKKSVELVILSERELKKMNTIQLHNWIEIGNFMKGKHKVFRRAVTAYLIQKLTKQYNNTFRKASILEKVSAPLAEKLKELYIYRDEYAGLGDERVYEDMVKIAEEHKLFDAAVYSVYKEVEFILLRLPFIEPMCTNINIGYGQDATPMIKIIRDLFKYYKQRMDWQHYNLPITEEVVEIKVEENINIEENEII